MLLVKWLQGIYSYPISFWNIIFSGLVTRILPRQTHCGLQSICCSEEIIYNYIQWYVQNNYKTNFHVLYIINQTYKSKQRL